jgi:hypothetical protein
MMDGGSGVGMGPEAGLPFTLNPYDVDTSCRHRPSVDFHEPLLPTVAASGGERLLTTTKLSQTLHTQRHARTHAHSKLSNTPSTQTETEPQVLSG